MAQEQVVLDIFSNLNEAIPIFHALADSERLFILLKLFYAGKNGMNVTDLSGKSRLSRPAISHHLKILKSAKIIKSRKEGTQVYYMMDLSENLNYIKNVIMRIQSQLPDIERKNEKLSEKEFENLLIKAQQLM